MILLFLLIVALGSVTANKNNEIQHPSFSDDSFNRIPLDNEGHFDRIVGGQEANIEDHPHQVSFLFDKNDGTYFCGGFIVSENYILTAGHCAKDVDPSTVVLRAGSSYRRNGTLIPIKELIVHPSYNNPQYDKDVAIMKTEQPIVFNEVMQPIPLPERGRAMNGGTDIVVSGWGRTQSTVSSVQDRLREVRVPVVRHWQCRFSYPSELTNNMFCAGNYFLGGKGTCQGDSGGAAQQDGMAVGIVSFGRGCAWPLNPGVFADIAAPDIRDFISKFTGL